MTNDQKNRRNLGKFMAKHLETGKLGEDLAIEHLRQLGYEVLATNWRHRKFEVDIIAKDAKTLVFIEVKTRSYDYFGKPEDFVTLGKEKRLSAAAAAYMEEHGHDWAVRFDVVALLKRKDGSFSIELIKDAFFPGLE